MNEFEHYEALARLDTYRSNAGRRLTRLQKARRRRMLHTLGLVLSALLILFAALWPAAVPAGKAAEPRLQPAAPSPTSLTEEPIEAAPAAVKRPRYSLIIENATVSHYCTCEICCGKAPDHPAYGVTASGRTAEPYYSVAVDPILIDLGTVLYLDYGDGVLHEVRADDTGSSITGAKIDLCVSDHAEALQLGLKTAAVYVEVPAL